MKPRNWISSEFPPKLTILFIDFVPYLQRQKIQNISIEGQVENLTTENVNQWWKKYFTHLIALSNQFFMI